MIIDLILDRKDGKTYDVYAFYHNVRQYENIFKFDPDISIALDYGSESDIKEALKRYISKQGYNPNINNYIDSVNWID